MKTVDSVAKLGKTFGRPELWASFATGLMWIVALGLPRTTWSQETIQKAGDVGEAFAENDLLRFSKPQQTPESNAYPPGRLGEVVRLGEELVNVTNEHPLTKPFVGNQLNCTSCHLDAGTHSEAASFVGVAAAYPAFSPRENSVITLEDRILNCFIRSQNGSRPPNGSEASVAIAAYITWLSRATPIAMNPVGPHGPNHLTMLDASKAAPSVERGQALYAQRCADCHSNDGSGNDDGPPVWGDQSFNAGAGLAQVPKLASWLKVAMPLDDADLTTEEAFDIAAYVNSHPRPKFKPSDHE